MFDFRIWIKLISIEQNKKTFNNSFGLPLLSFEDKSNKRICSLSPPLFILFLWQTLRMQIKSSNRILKSRLFFFFPFQFKIQDSTFDFDSWLSNVTFVVKFFLKKNFQKNFQKNFHFSFLIANPFVFFSFFSFDQH